MSRGDDQRVAGVVRRKAVLTLQQLLAAGIDDNEACEQIAERFNVNPKAKKGWRHALKRVVVRHLGIENTGDGAPRRRRSFGFMVSPAVAAKAGQPDSPGWDPFEGLGAWERELGVEDLEAVPELAESGAEGWP